MGDESKMAMRRVYSLYRVQQYIYTIYYLLAGLYGDWSYDSYDHRIMPLLQTPDLLKLGHSSRIRPNMFLLGAERNLGVCCLTGPDIDLLTWSLIAHDVYKLDC
jgi:hypothetical protein